MLLPLFVVNKNVFSSSGIRILWSEIRRLLDEHSVSLLGSLEKESFL